MLLSIIFSFKNEEEVLPELIRRVTETLNPLKIEYELIFVNDGSSDRSLVVLNEQRGKDKRIKIINMSRTFGGPHCVMAGLKHASGDAVIYMDSDLQDPPELIPTILQKWKDGADVVHTTRTNRKGESFTKMLITKLAYKLINMVSNIEIPKNCGDFKLLSRRVVDALLRLNENDPFVRGLVSWVGFKQVHVCYERDVRFAGETHYSLLKSLGPMKEFIRGATSFSSIPLYFALFVGFLVSCGAFGYLVYVLVSRLFFGMHMPGWPAIMATNLFLGGTILFTIGVMGIYIGRIHNDIKKRPSCIIESTVGFENE